MAAPSATRSVRGCYAHQICLNCRSRKIKCRLPEVYIEPSADPQPSETACQRCSSLGLQCIVQPTVLGRPAAKRKRHATYSDGTEASMSTARRTLPDNPRLSDADVKSYILSTVREGESSPNTGEVFKAMISPTHLTSALLAHDRQFGSSTPLTRPRAPLPLHELISNGMAKLLDEHLLWHRFYLRLTPTLTSLRQCLLIKPSCSINPATALLFALLSLIALDVPSNPLKDDNYRREMLRDAIAHYGPELLFTLPTHRHTLAVLMLLANYNPTILISHQRTASASIRAELYIALAYRVAERLNLQSAEEILRSYVDNPTAFKDIDIEAYLTNCLQWLQILFADASLDGFIVNPLAQMTKALNRMKPIIDAIQAVLKMHRPRACTLYHAYYFQGVCTSMGYHVAAKESWRNFERLSLIILTHEACCADLRADLESALCRSVTGDGPENDANVIQLLFNMEIDERLVEISGAAMFYAIMSTMKSESEADGIEPEEAVQLSDQIIHNFKEPLTKTYVLEINKFLDKFGPPRLTRLEGMLSNFVYAADTLRLGNVSFLPPPKWLALSMLFHCKNIVEENAARMKGWSELHPNVDEQLTLLATCADRFEAMTVTGNRTLDSVFAEGSMFAASAKLIRCLHGIMLGWKATVASNSADHEATHEAPSGVLNAGNSFDSVTDLEFEELLGQWDLWPRAEAIDFNQLLPDQSPWL